MTNLNHELTSLENKVNEVINILKRIKRNAEEPEDTELHSRRAIRELESIQIQIRSSKS
jgi:hypothetical protein